MIQELSKEPVFDGVGYEPSPYSLAANVPSKTDYDYTVYPHANQDKHKRVLVVCSEDKYLEVEGGKKFSTGNHPIETLVPILHFEAAGFACDIYTSHGKPVQLEMWAMPSEDEAVKGIYAKYKSQLEHPKSLEAGVDPSIEYVAMFLPGGHGALINLPQDKNLGALIRSFDKSGKYVAALCHGPAALLSASLNCTPEEYPYKGYQMNGFPNGIDNILPTIGYLPAQLTWHYGEKLQALGVDILNTDITGACHIDRKLISGDSPLAANAFGKLCANTLLGNQ